MYQPFYPVTHSRSVTLHITDNITEPWFRVNLSHLHSKFSSAGHAHTIMYKNYKHTIFMCMFLWRVHISNNIPKMLWLHGFFFFLAFHDVIIIAKQ